MKHKYQHPTALVAEPRLLDLLAASDEPITPGGDDPENPGPGTSDPGIPGPGTSDPGASDPAAPDLDWN
ncbi:MAG: hypothetical protein IJY16_08080 [Clostridia bacterium]|nr:hypothetical protein [Clostridia bacterium]